MKHIIKFQKFLENTQSTIDKILDKISSGEEISKYVCSAFLKCSSLFSLPSPEALPFLSSFAASNGIYKNTTTSGLGNSHKSNSSSKINFNIV